MQTNKECRIVSLKLNGENSRFIYIIYVHINNHLYLCSCITFVMESTVREKLWFSSIICIKLTFCYNNSYSNLNLRFSGEVVLTYKTVNDNFNIIHSFHPLIRIHYILLDTTKSVWMVLMAFFSPSFVLKDLELNDIFFLRVNLALYV